MKESRQAGSLLGLLVSYLMGKWEGIFVSKVNQQGKKTSINSKIAYRCSLDT